MKRESLFRGKLSHSKRWIEGNLIIASNGKPYIIPSENIEPDGHHLMIEDKAFWVDYETVGEFTGEKDIEDVKIFEKDNVSSKNHHIKGIVIFDKGCFSILITSSKSLQWDVSQKPALFEFDDLLVNEAI